MSSHLFDRSAIVRFKLAPNNRLEFEGGAGSSAILPTADATPLAAQLVALALFPVHDLPVLLAGDDLRLTLNPDNAHPEQNNAGDVAADRSTLGLHARSSVTLRREFDPAELRTCVKPCAGLRSLQITSDDTNFLAVYSASGSARMITVLPTSSRAPSRSILRVHALDVIPETPCALYCSGSQRAYFISRRESVVSLVVPPVGGDIVFGAAHKTRNGNIVSVLQPADVTLKTSASVTPPTLADQRRLALQRGILSLPALCAIAWFFLTTLLRCLPAFAPVRLALALTERSERFMNDRVFGIPPRAPAPVQSKSRVQNGGAVASAADEIELAFPPQGKKTNLVTLLVRSTVGASLPSLYFGTVRANVVSQKLLEPDGTTMLLQVQRSVNAPTLRVVF